MLRTFWLCILMLGTMGVARGQFSAIIYYYANCEVPLTMECAGGEPIPNGTTVEIYWDQNNNGPDEADNLVPIGGGFGQANFNTFPMDDALIGCPGTFATETAFSINTNTPQPSRYWLRVCVPGQERQWRSNAFTIVDGLGEYDLSPNFNCVEVACAGCLTPPTVEALQASSDDCNGVSIAWADYPVVQGVNNLQIHRDGSLLVTIPRTISSYYDSAATLGVHEYQITAQYVDQYGQIPDCFSLPATVNGVRLNVPNVEGVEATNDLCQLTVTWSDVDGESHYRIYRDGVFRASVAANITGFVDDFALQDILYSYTVHAQVGSCLTGASNAATGSRTNSPAPPLNVTASDEYCDGIAVNWADVSHETGYRIKRNGVTIATVNANVTSYIDMSPGAHAYRVQAFNTCGASFYSVPDSGHTDTAPTMLSLTTSSPDCDGITLTYSATPNTDTVKLYRNAVLIAAQLGGNGVYEDSPPNAGTFIYSARAIGDCGVSNVIGGVNGTLLEYPSGPAMITTTQDSCETITVNWVPATGDFGYYRVSRDGVELATVSNSETTFLDPSAIGGIEYSYAVVAVNDTCGQSVDFDSVTAAIVLGSLPAAPEIVITIQNLDAVLTWSPIDSTLEGCPIAPSRYLVYYSENTNGPFFYHGSTTDTTYRHAEVVRFAADMYYQVETFVGPVALLSTIPDGGVFTRDEVMARLPYRNTR